MLDTMKDNDEFITIDFKALLRIFKSELKLIAFFIFVPPLLGILYTLNSPKEYAAIGKIMPEVTHKAPNGMGGLYEILKKYNGGLDSYNPEITRPELYDEIVKTKTFYDYLLSKNVEMTNGKKMEFKTYYESHLMLKKLLTQKKLLDSASDARTTEYSCQQNLQKRIVITTVKKNNLILVSVEMPDPMVAANIANFTIDYLVDYIAKYRTEKARQELFFIENLLKNSQKEGFSKEIHNGLLVSVVQMKIKIQEDTPIFQILEYAPIPVISSNPSVFYIITPCVLIGLLTGIIVALFRKHNFRMLLG
jgi:uncharacterized protein involved in exopolysaccharide biosynthesis